MTANLATDPDPSTPPQSNGELSLPSRPPMSLVAVREVVLRYRGPALRASPVRSPNDAVQLAQRIVHDDSKEHFLALYLDGRHCPIGHGVVSVGTATASLVHPREVYQAAVLLGSVAVVVLHNHPSGNESPSVEDREVTKRLADAGRLLGIPLLDSIVFTRSGLFESLRDQHPDAFASPASLPSLA